MDGLLIDANDAGDDGGKDDTDNAHEYGDSKIIKLIDNNMIQLDYLIEERKQRKKLYQRSAALFGKGRYFQGTPNFCE